MKEIYQVTTYRITCDICEDYIESQECNNIEWLERYVGTLGWKTDISLSNGIAVDVCPHCSKLTDKEMVDKWTKLQGP